MSDVSGDVTPVDTVRRSIRCAVRFALGGRRRDVVYQERQLWAIASVTSQNNERTMLVDLRD